MFLHGVKLWGGWFWWGKAVRSFKTETINIHKTAKKEWSFSEKINYKWFVFGKHIQGVGQPRRQLPTSQTQGLCFHFLSVSTFFFARLFTLLKKQFHSINIILFLLTINTHMLPHTNEKSANVIRNSFQRFMCFIAQVRSTPWEDKMETLVNR